jgi:hypothetical protein
MVHELGGDTCSDHCKEGLGLRDCHTSESYPSLIPVAVYGSQARRRRYEVITARRD